MKACIIIPARFESTRFPGKPLAEIDGRPLIEWTWRAAMMCQIRDVFIATDDERIARVAARLPARVVATPSTCLNGTERCAAALEILGGGYDIVVNWQGDAPLIPSRFANGLIGLLQRDLEVNVATSAYPGTAHDGCVAVEIGKYSGNAMRFERVTGDVPVLHHVGIYAYRGDALRRYATHAETPYERVHGLEQSRWESFDQPIRVKVMEAPTWPLREVNFPEDIEIVADVLKQRDAAVRT